MLATASPQLRDTRRSAGKVVSRRALCRSGSIHHAIVAALNAGMIFVARSQYERVDDASGKVSLDSNLSAVVDIERTRQLQIGVGREQSVQVDHRPAVIRQDCTEIGTTCMRMSHNV